MKHDNKIDLLRFIATIMVIIIHISGNMTYQVSVRNFLVGNVFNSLSRISVPIFVMISGALNLSNEKNSNKQNYYKKQAKNIFIPTILFSFMYFLYNYLKIFVKNDFSFVNVDIKTFVQPLILWINGAPYNHLWYMYMYFGLIFITPYLVMYIHNGENNIKKTGFIFIFIGIILKLTSTLFWPFKFVKYLGFYILGYYYYNKKDFTYKNIFLYIFTSFLIMLFSYYNYKYNIEFNGTIINYNKGFHYEYLSPLVVIGSISFFKFVISIKKVNFQFSKFNQHSFYIYLFHYIPLGFFTFLYQRIFNVDFYKNINPFFTIISLTILVYLFSLVLSIIYNKTIYFMRGKFKTNNV